MFTTWTGTQDEIGPLDGIFQNWPSSGTEVLVPARAVSHGRIIGQKSVKGPKYSVAQRGSLVGYIFPQENAWYGMRFLLQECCALFCGLGPD